MTGALGPILGGLVGAHVGSLFSFSRMKEAGEKEQGGHAPRENRHAGMLVAVGFDEPGLQARAVEVLRGLGATQVERAMGKVVDGDWLDFDPGSVPELIG